MVPLGICKNPWKVHSSHLLRSEDPFYIIFLEIDYDSIKGTGMSILCGQNDWQNVSGDIWSRFTTKITKCHHRLTQCPGIRSLACQLNHFCSATWSDHWRPSATYGEGLVLWPGVQHRNKRSGNKQRWKHKKPKGCKSASQETLHRRRSACWTGRRSQPGRLHGLMSW